MPNQQELLEENLTAAEWILPQLRTNDFGTAGKWSSDGSIVGSACRRQITGGILDQPETSGLTQHGWTGQSPSVVTSQLAFPG